MFPRDRFERAGASQEELDQLEAEYDASSPAEQESHDQRFEGQAESYLREHLDGLRKTRHFDNEIPGVESGESGEQPQGDGTDGGGNPVGGSVNDPQSETPQETPEEGAKREAHEKAEQEAKEKADAEAKQRSSGSSR